MNAHHPWILVSLHTNATNLRNMIDILPKIVKLEQATIPMLMCRTLMIKQRDSTWVKRHIFKSEKKLSTVDDSPCHMLVPGHGGWN